MSRQPTISVVVVAYQAPEALDRCLASITTFGKEQTEVVVVDNERVNRGFSGGVNTGVNLARGEFVFLLNPDAEIHRESIQALLQMHEKQEAVGVAAPQLVDVHGNWYLNHSLQPTVITAPIVYSGLNRLFSWTELVRRHWFMDSPEQSARNVGIVSGAAMFMKREVFIEIAGFDERFFMYWEEVDFCRRLQQQGLSIWYWPEARVTHLGGASSPTRAKRMGWFRQSRFLFFKKHFGRVYAIILELWLRLSEQWRWVVGLGIAAILLRFLWSY